MKTKVLAFLVAIVGSHFAVADSNPCIGDVVTCTEGGIAHQYPGNDSCNYYTEGGIEHSYAYCSKPDHENDDHGNNRRERNPCESDTVSCMEGGISYQYPGSDSCNYYSVGGIQHSYPYCSKGN